jgi:formylglycine-generating enzyme required for sulfatase activity
LGFLAAISIGSGGKLRIHPAVSGIFISYRREDSSGWAGRLSHALRKNFGADQVFIDINTIEPGVVYTAVTEEWLTSCDVVLVLIGPRWLTVTDKKGQRRLDNPRDLVRIEVAVALRRGIRVVPVLIGGAAMPSIDDLPEDLEELVRLNAYELSDKRWDYDQEQLARFLKKTIYVASPFLPNARKWWTIGISFAVLLIVGSYIFRMEPPSPPDKPSQDVQGMALIPGGTFVRGSWDAAEDARPPREIRVNNFYMDRHEVSWSEFNEYLNATGDRYQPPNWVKQYIPGKDYPVLGVSWQAAFSFCAWKHKRLPSEAEWERAARGAANHLYPWGDKLPALASEPPPYPAPIYETSFDRSPQGVVNLMSNVREWVQDWYHSDFYATSPDENPVNVEPSEYRVVRGGSWLTSSAPPMASERGANNPERPDLEIGFRCVLDPKR